MGTNAQNKPNLNALEQVSRTLQLVWRLMLDPRVPAVPKLIIPAIIIYVVSPIDLIPDLLPIVGQIDDVGVIFFGIRLFLQMCPPDVVLEHRRALGGAPSSPKEEFVDASYRVVDDD